MRDHAGFLFLYLYDSKVFEKLFNADKTLAEKFINAVKRAIEKLRQFFKENPTYARTEYGKALQEAMSKVENRVQELWDEAVAQGIRAENNNTSNVELKTRYSERDDILNHFGIPERKLSDYVFVQRNVYRTLDSNGFFNKSEKIGNNIRKYRIDTNVETGIVVETGKKGIKETFNFDNYGKYSKELKLQKLAVIDMLPEIIKNGHLVAENVPNYHKENSGVNFLYFQSDIKINDETISVKVAVKKSSQRNSFWVHSIVTNKKSTELAPDGATPDSGYKSLNAENTIPQSASKINTPDEKPSDRFDTDYLSAVERGDMKTAQQMVDEAAKAAGYDIHLYHGAKSGGGFTVFKDWQYFTKNKPYAERYTQRETGKGLYDVFVKSSRMFDTRNADDRAIFEQYRSEYGMSELTDNGLPDWTDGYDLSEIIEENNLDYDGIILNEGGDLVNGKPVSRGASFVIRKSSQIKSADPVTYDDDGKVIPLSERFNEEKEDIRYSDRFSNALTGAEWAKYNNAMKTGNDAGLRISDNSMLVECEEGNIYDYKFIIYDSSFEDNSIEKIYAIGGLSNNTPEARTIANYIEKMEDKGYDRQKILDRILRPYAEEFGFFLRRYNGKTGRYNHIGGTFTKSRADFVDKSNGTATFTAAGQIEKLKYQDRYNEYDDLFDMGEDLFEDSSKREILDELIEKYPDDALYIIKHAAEQTVENFLTNKNRCVALSACTAVLYINLRCSVFHLLAQERRRGLRELYLGGGGDFYAVAAEHYHSAHNVA